MRYFDISLLATSHLRRPLFQEHPVVTSKNIPLPKIQFAVYMLDYHINNASKCETFS